MHLKKVASELEGLRNDFDINNTTYNKSILSDAGFTKTTRKTMPGMLCDLWTTKFTREKIICIINHHLVRKHGMNINPGSQHYRVLYINLV